MDKDTVILRNKKDSKRIRQCRVVFSYKQDHEDELNLNIGDIIDILGEEEEGWWKGILNGKVGVFPSNFVEEIIVDKLKSSREDLNATENGDSHLPNQPTKILCEVKYSYKAQNEDELNLKEGDIVTLLSKDGQDPGWWKGELNGLIGVFPDNFVVIVPYNNEKNTNGKTPTYSLKPSSIASQRKSLENKSQNVNEKTDISDNKVSPPVPNKKPVIAVKKSPSSNVSPGGLFKEIKKKIVDVVDGATSSKTASNLKNESGDSSTENVFDQVERVGLLTDVRATRAKAPGRRPPSMVFREEDSPPIIPNGNSDQLEMVTELTPSITDPDGTEVKPKLREWEKHKAPWLAEMKLNQAKRTTPSPNQAENKPPPRLTPTETEEAKLTRNKQQDGDMSKSFTSMSSTPLSSKTSKGDVEKVPMRPKPNVATPRPTSIRSVSPVALSPAATGDSKPVTPSRTPSSPTVAPKTPSSPTKTPASPFRQTSVERSAATANIETKNCNIDETSTRHLQDSPTPASSASVTYKQYVELLERVHKLEMALEKQGVTYAAAIEELKGKLQLETEMRHMLQEEDSSLESSEEPEERFRCNTPSILYVLTTFLGIISMALTLLWCFEFGGGFSLKIVDTEMNWHLFLSIFGSIFLYGQILLFKRNEKKFSFARIRTRDSESAVLLLKFLLLVVLILLIFKFGRRKEGVVVSIPNMYSLHSWLGVAAVVFFLVDFMASLCLHVFYSRLYAAVREALAFVCKVSCIMAFFAFISASISGLNEKTILSYRDFSTLPDGAIVLNFIGVFVIFFGCLVMNLLLKKRLVV